MEILPGFACLNAVTAGLWMLGARRSSWGTTARHPDKYELAPTSIILTGRANRPRPLLLTGTSPCSTPQFVRDNLEAVRANCRNRGVTADVDAVVRLDDARRAAQRLFDDTRAAQNRISEQIKSAGKDKELRDKLVAESRGMKDQLAAYEADAKRLESELRAALLPIPNMTHPDAPVGTTPTPPTGWSRCPASRPGSTSR